MSLKLYFAPQTRSITALWMLLEAGAPYEIVRVNIRAPGHPSAEFRQVNPMGKVPALQDGGLGFGETSAILLYIADKFPQAKLAPLPTDPNRGRFLQWLMYPPTTIEPAMMEKRRGSEPMTTAAGWGDYDRAMAALESAMTPGQWLFGDQFTAADLYVASSLGFGMMFGMIDKRPAFVEFSERASARPAYKKAREIEAAEVAKG
jgi:glutathione S-transferase